MVDYDIPVNWVNQQNVSYITIDNPPNFGDIDFFFTEVSPRYGSDNIIYYYQDIQNLTTVASCIHIWE